ncbi:MAG: NADH-quinone oxidoreductase subunit J [Candidatus Brocadia sp. AMX2]|uniref:NADH-quinone oxidoreductase subunit J n=1 Tax=Candidatus Brocadia sinica JPN1 TaxID=1197129 RepID=A0ABQ0JUZ8_9BACT|nr:MULTISPECIES: NADH-quinone oxidoreductase subunit J [Brocadia]KXK32877.1 MAG: NADH dehydrogenase I subunit J [Candidatus Brocadia sinica]MBC6933832.1 NADH-quinone oxidoreductase subunit J [Candidatus Brocadia sp.]MBL1167853.1 NADH-quinone oxidoreductase subunit J [Candidatus Brocadia sp. AMX1]NOG41582.1 NADH-quinone oxidoreductase subunit J [Planctomycetota bacterium]KAA0241548.1 MAG: NADH-quinone oxidoreductase subunit J [Candidatus Brocadia sp. AMX2]
MEAYLFYIMAAVAVTTAVYLIFEKNPVFGALYLIQTMVSIAVLYILLEAQFIAAVQIIVYAGAIMVLFLFVIMLLNLNIKEEAKNALPFQRIPAILMGIALFTVICIVLRSKLLQGKQGEYTTAYINSIGNTKLIGNVLFTDYLLPFEITSILLFVAAIGAIMLAKRKL